jgi:hypothetical protein
MPNNDICSTAQPRVTSINAARAASESDPPVLGVTVFRHGMALLLDQRRAIPSNHIADGNNRTKSDFVRQEACQ